MDFIDEEWLNQNLRYEIRDGYLFDGCQVGGSWVVVKFVHPDGKAYGLRLSRDLFALASYLKEIPNHLAPRPMYDLARLNEKLSNLLGDPVLPHLVFPYRDLFTGILGSLREAGVSALNEVRFDSEEDARAWRFLVCTDPIRYLLEDLASSSGSPATRSLQHPVFTASSQDTVQWANRALDSLNDPHMDVPDLLPGRLLANPLFVWGGAAMSGYFTRQDLPSAAAAVLEHLGQEGEGGEVFLAQTVILVEALERIVGKSLRLRLLCDATEAFPWRFTDDQERAQPDEFITLGKELFHRPLG